MKLLVVGPSRYSWGSTGYGGVERLCGLIVQGLARRGHEVIAAAPEGSTLPPGVAWIHVPLDEGNDYGELEAYKRCRSLLDKKDIDAVVDLSHKHILRWKEGWPGLSWIWHDPYVNVGVKLPTTGVRCLSDWQRQRLLERTGVASQVCDIHTVDGSYTFDPEMPSNGRWLWLGRMDRDKGAVVAARAFAEAGIGLDMVGPCMERAVVEEVCQIEKEASRSVHWHGELLEEQKLAYLQSAEGMFYWPGFPNGISEAHSMKVVEALCCGLPPVLKDIEPYREVFSNFCIYTQSPQVNAVTQLWAQDSDRGPLSSYARARWGLDVISERIERELQEALE